MRREGLHIICANEKCTNIIVVGKNRPGMPRKYCSYKCGQQQRSREYYRRQTGPGELEPDPQYPQVKRVMPRTASHANDLRLAHLDNCPVARPEDLGRCPSRFDPYCVERECLIYAVMCDDWDLLRRKEKFGDPGDRRNTTDDGYWNDRRPPTREEQIARAAEMNAVNDIVEYPERELVP